MTDDLTDRLRRVRLLVCDVDGVLTDGAVYYGASGEELKRFHVRDGSALKLWRLAGNEAALVSGRASPATARRAAELGIPHCLQGRDDKASALRELLALTGHAPEEVAAVGDDLIDLGLFAGAGVRVAVADACADVREAADVVTPTPGGYGAVRDAVETILRAQGHWERLTARFRPAG